MVGRARTGNGKNPSGDLLVGLKRDCLCPSDPTSCERDIRCNRALGQENKKVEKHEHEAHFRRSELFRRFPAQEVQSLHPQDQL